MKKIEDINKFLNTLHGLENGSLRNRVSSEEYRILRQYQSLIKNVLDFAVEELNKPFANEEFPRSGFTAVTVRCYDLAHKVTTTFLCIAPEQMDELRCSCGANFQTNRALFTVHESTDLKGFSRQESLKEEP
jgi:hypothetical protein